MTSGGGPHDSGEYKPLPYTRWAIVHTRTSCCVSGWLYASFALAILVLTIVGEDVVPFSIYVPLYLRDIAERQRDDAFREGKNAANASRDEGDHQPPQSVKYLEVEILYLLQNAKEGKNIAHTKYCEQIAAFEEALVELPGYQEHCYRAKDEELCQRPVSFINFLDPDYLNTAPIFAGGNGTNTTLSFNGTVFGDIFGDDDEQEEDGEDGDDEFDLQQLFDAASNLEIDTGTSKAYNNSAIIEPDLSQGNVDSTLKQWVQFSDLQPDQFNPLWVVVDGEFGIIGEQRVQIKGVLVMRTTLELGYPLAGYASVQDRKEEQELAIEQWAYETFDVLVRENTTDHLRVLLTDSRGALENLHATDVLFQDVVLVAAALVFVWLYLTLMTHSLFLSSISIFHIFLSLGPSMLLYRYLFRVEYFGSLNMLTLFIIVGIGADDIFVFLDAWNQSRSQTQEIASNIHNRMSYAYRRASFAMLITSLTTMASFLANTTSLFPAISTFGLFSALVVGINYIAIITFYPTAVLYYHKWYEQKRGVYDWALDGIQRFINWSNETWSRIDDDQDPIVLSIQSLASGIGLNLGQETQDHFFDDDDKPPSRELSTEFVLPRRASVDGTVTVKKDNDDEKEEEEGQGHGKGGFRGSISHGDLRADPLKKQTVSFASPPVQSCSSLDKVSSTVVASAFSQVVHRRNTQSTTSDTDISQTQDKPMSNKKSNLRVSKSFFSSGERIETLGRIEMFFLRTYYPFIFRMRWWLFLLFIPTFFFFLTFGALALVPDPDVPILLPDGDPYRDLDVVKEDYLSRFESWYNLRVNLVFGIVDGIDRTGTNYADGDDRGVMSFDDSFDVRPPAVQEWLIRICDDLGVENDGRQVKPNREDPVQCFMKAWKEYREDKNESFPIPADEMGTAFIEFMDDDEEYPNSMGFPETNYDRWKQYVYGEVVDHSRNITDPWRYKLRVGVVEVSLNFRADDSFTDGIELSRIWDAWWQAEKELPGFPDELKGGFVQNGAFHYFYVQERIISEAYSGIGLSLGAAFIIICLATHNWVVSLLAVINIAFIVTCVMSFIVFMGWKLGILEAIILVLVVGMSVDYVVHCTESYVSAKKCHTRHGKVRYMLTHVGVSVVSGAITTLGASTFMLFGRITFITKFGTLILFLVFASMTSALAVLPPLLLLFGPTGTQGELTLKPLMRWFSKAFRSCCCSICPVRGTSAPLEQTDGEEMMEVKVHRSLSPELNKEEHDSEDGKQISSPVGPLPNSKTSKVDAVV